MRLSALACICTSLLALKGLTAQDATATLAAATFTEMELVAARQPKVYMLLDPQRSVIEIRARGAVLDRVTLHGIELISQQSLLRTSLPLAPSIPAKWTVKIGPGDTDREIIAPKELRPEPKEDEEEEAPDKDAPTPVPAGPTPTPTPFPEAPTDYRVQLTNGWDLWVTTQLPPQGRLNRFFATVSDGWRRMRGSGTDLAPAITLLMGVDDARRLHHLFRTGTEILVGPGPD